MPLANLPKIQEIGTKLEKTLGVEYEFKLATIEFFKQLFADGFLVVCASSCLILVEDEYPLLFKIEADPDYLYDLLLTAPSMGFSAKEDAYELVRELTDFFLEAIDSGTAFTAGPELDLLEDTLVEDFLVGDSIYVGLEGEGDYHFMDYFYRWSEVVLDLLEIAI